MIVKAVRNVALLIDADNASAQKVEPVLAVLAAQGAVNVRRVYGNWSKPCLQGWAEATPRYGLEPRQQFDLTKGKNATDMSMTIDAMDLLHGGRIATFGIMSSDSDFTPLAMRLKQDGAAVYGFGTAKTPEPFQQACTQFIDVTSLVVGACNKVAPAAAVAGAPAKKPDSAVAAIDNPKIRQRLIEAYNASKHDDQGFASLSEIGTHAGDLSRFRAGSGGVKRLSKLFEKLPDYKTERREGGSVWVKRAR